MTAYPAPDMADADEVEAALSELLRRIKAAYLLTPRLPHLPHQPKPERRCTRRPLSELNQKK